MTAESVIRILAGTVVLVSLALGTLWTPWALALAAFVAVNLIQSSFTGFCPAERLVTKLPFVRSGASCGAGEGLRP